MNLWKKLLTGTTLVAFATSVGCATIFTGTSDSVTIQSEPSGAKIFVDGVYSGKTTVSISMKRNQDHHILIKKEGYEDATTTVTRSLNVVSILNLTSILCWVVDVVTGAMWKFDQHGISVTLDKLGKQSSQLLKSTGKILTSDDLKQVPYNGKTALILNAQAAH